MTSKLRSEVQAGGKGSLVLPLERIPIVVIIPIIVGIMPASSCQIALFALPLMVLMKAGAVGQVRLQGFRMQGCLGFRN